MNLVNINIRRMMFFIEKRISLLVYERKFECKSSGDLLTLQDKCTEEVLADVKDRKGIFSFEIERTEPNKSKATILFQKDSEPVIMNWELEVNEIPKDKNSCQRNIKNQLEIK